MFQPSTFQLFNRALEKLKATLTVRCKINIIRKYDGSVFHDTYQIPQKFYHGQCIRFQWKLNREILDRMKLAMDDASLCLYSKEYRGVFGVKIYPNFENKVDFNGFFSFEFQQSRSEKLLKGSR